MATQQKGDPRRPPPRHHSQRPDQCQRRQPFHLPPAAEGHQGVGRRKVHLPGQHGATRLGRGGTERCW